MIKSAGHLGRNRPNTIKGRYTQYDFLACDKLMPCTARVLTHPLLVCLIFPKYSPVRNKNVITENLSTGLDLTRVLFRDTEQTNPYGRTTKASLSQKILTITIGKVLYESECFTCKSFIFVRYFNGLTILFCQSLPEL